MYKVTLKPRNSSKITNDDYNDDGGGDTTLCLLRTGDYSTAKDALWRCLYAFPLRLAVVETIEKAKRELMLSRGRSRKKSTEINGLRKELELSKARVSDLEAEVSERLAATKTAESKATRARAEVKRLEDTAIVATAVATATATGAVSAVSQPATPAAATNTKPAAVAVASAATTSTCPASHDLAYLSAKLQEHESAIRELSGRLAKQKLKFCLMPPQPTKQRQKSKERQMSHLHQQQHGKRQKLITDVKLERFEV